MIVSSHVLHEVERMAPRVLVLVNGHLVAEGETGAIRQLISERPRQRAVLPRRRRPRARARAASAPASSTPCGSPDGTIEVETSEPTRFSRAAAGARARAHRHALRGSSRSATTSRASTPTCTTAPGGRRDDLPVYRLTLRALLLQRRTIVLAVVAAGAGADRADLCAGRQAGSARHWRFYSDIVQQLFVPTVAALVALVFGVSAFGDEREDGTILYLVATPQPRLELVVAKVAAAWTASLVLLVPSLVLASLLILGGSAASLRLIGWPLLGVVLASLAYCAASCWLSLQTRRPVVIGVIYILLWEGSIATFAASAAKLSISAYGRAFVAHELPQAELPVAGPGTAVIVLAVVTGARLLAGSQAAVAGGAALVREVADRRALVEPPHGHRQQVVQGVDLGGVGVVQRIDPACQRGVVGGQFSPLSSGGGSARALDGLLASGFHPGCETQTSGRAESAQISRLRFVVHALSLRSPQKLVNPVPGSHKPVTKHPRE